jgi:cardiolipin synthase
MRSTEGNRADLVVDGPACRGALLDLIAGAEQRLHLATFIFRADTAGHEVADALAGRARAGVEVRVLLDPGQSASALFAEDARGPGRADVDALVADLRGAGVEVRPMQPGGRRPVVLGAPIDHRKLVVADGERALVPSHGVGDTYLYPDGEPEGRTRWHDAATGVIGPAVADLDRVFRGMWRRYGGDDPGARPVPAEAGADRITVIDSPAGGEVSPLRDLYARGLLERAEREVVVENPYVADQEVFAGWAEGLAARPDLRVTLIRPHPELSDYLPPRVPAAPRLGAYIARRHDAELRAAGVEVLEATDAFHHLKLAVVDDRVSVHGSYNLTYRSALLDPEVGIVVEGPGHPPQVRALLEADRAAADPAPGGGAERRALAWVADRVQRRIG